MSGSSILAVAPDPLLALIEQTRKRKAAEAAEAPAKAPAKAADEAVAAVGAAAGSASGQRKGKLDACNRDTRCSRGKDHAGECAFPNHVEHTNSDGKTFVLTRSEKKGERVFAGVYRPTNQPKGRNVSDQRPASSQKHWFAHHVGCRHLGCTETGQLGGKNTEVEAALLLAEHKAEFGRCQKCDQGNEPLGNQIVLCDGSLETAKHARCSFT